MAAEIYPTSNLEVALLHKFNKLAERHGLNPCDFVVTLSLDHEVSKGYALDIEMLPEDPKELAKALKMLKGSPDFHELPDTTWEMRGKDARDIYNSLVAALEKAPRSRSR